MCKGEEGEGVRVRACSGLCAAGEICQNMHVYASAYVHVRFVNACACLQVRIA